MFRVHRGLSHRFRAVSLVPERALGGGILQIIVGEYSREFSPERSGTCVRICDLTCVRDPLTMSGSLTEPAGGHKLDRVCDLRFFVV